MNSTVQKYIPAPSIVLAFLIGALLVGSRLVFGFTEPVSAPPTCTAENPGCDAPLHVGAVAQTKSGSLILNIGGAPNGFAVASGRVGIGTLFPTQALDVAGYIKGTGICLGSSPCIESWSATSAETDPTVQSWAKTGSPSIPGDVTVSGTIRASGGTPIYQCPNILDDQCRRGCVGQLTTNTTCTDYTAFGGGCQNTGTKACMFVGRLVAP